MERNPLQNLLGSVPDGVQGVPNHVDLGNKTWTVGNIEPDNPFPFAITDPRHDLVLTGNGAQIIVADAAEGVHRCGVLLRGTRIWLAGDVTIVGPRPDNHGWYEPREFEHAVRIEGAIGCSVGWKWRNFWGSGAAIGRRRVSGQPDRRTKNIKINCPDSRQVGRQHVNVDDADHADISFQGTDCVRSALDVEIPGHSGHVNNLVYHDTDIRGHWNGFALANNGIGQTVGGCEHWTIQRVRCHGSPFMARIAPPAGVRRRDYHFLDCGSDAQTNIPPIKAYRLDGLEVKRFAQVAVVGAHQDPVELVNATDCTAVETDCRTVQDGVLTHT